MKKIFILLSLIIILLNTKAVSAATINCNNTLTIGSTGEQVKILQEELNRTMRCNLDVDGIIGSRTKSCILKFQKKYNLTVDGIVGPKTCSKLNKVYTTLSKYNYTVVTGDIVNLRNNISLTDNSIIGTVKRGTVLRIYSTQTVDGITWYKVYTKLSNNSYKQGYINAKYTKKTILLLNIANQQLTYYYNGKVLMDVPVITGQIGKYDTPIGMYEINPNNKTTNTTLKGLNDDGTTYNAYVNYWMPFITNRGIGFHDASWRNIDDYTTTTYKQNGSHGCVNMRPNDAKELYENIKTVTTVIVK